MIDFYKKAVDNIVASEDLQNNTIMKLRSKMKESNKRKVFTYKNCAAFFCFLITVASVIVLYKEIFNPNSNLVPGSDKQKNEISITLNATKNRTMQQNTPDTVQARILKEEAISINISDSANFAGPIYKNIKDRYANSQNVIKGYVYSTQYFWHSSDISNQLYTKSVIVIEKSFKGSLKAGEKINVIEHGGVTTLGEWFEKMSVKEKKIFEKVPENYDPYNGKSPNTLVDYTGLGKICTMRTGQDVVLFLNPDNLEFFGKNGEPGYRIIGYYGGKMVLNNGIYQAAISPDLKNLVKDESCVESELDNLMESARSSN